MEYASGGCLQDLLNNRGYLDMDSVLYYAAEMVCGLQFLHSEGIIHRDFKPENILFSNKGHIKIADFGLAAENVFGNKTISGSIGTLHNMAPEMIQCQIYNSAVDWWAFGIVLCKMATGRSPFYEGRKAEKCIHFILNCQPSYSEQLSTELQDLLEKLLKKKPYKRLGFKGDIRRHPFFKSINWIKVEIQNVEPPFQPEPQPNPDVSIPASALEVLNIDTASTHSYSLQDFTYLSPSWQA
ncbi:protein kinase C delta type-like [Xenopus laevis]|uniref:Protein kinase C delta type-like n=1 Tax=Xenopus laevis TaxID=8355 RepID=A0A8J1KRZ0_XENLA|nr:protein kinase C delta type-like [Xenopus laevis]